MDTHPPQIGIEEIAKTGAEPAQGTLETLDRIPGVTDDEIPGTVAPNPEYFRAGRADLVGVIVAAILNAGAEIERTPKNLHAGDQLIQ